MNINSLYTVEKREQKILSTAHGELSQILVVVGWEILACDSIRVVWLKHVDAFPQHTTARISQHHTTTHSTLLTLTDVILAPLPTLSHTLLTLSDGILAPPPTLPYTPLTTLSDGINAPQTTHTVGWYPYPTLPHTLLTLSDGIHATHPTQPHTLLTLPYGIHGPLIVNKEAMLLDILHSVLAKTLQSGGTSRVWRNIFYLSLT